MNVRLLPYAGSSHRRIALAPVQDDWRAKRKAGWIAWWEHQKAWYEYNRRYRHQSAETIASRGGFGYEELIMLLGREPITWEERK